MDNSKIQCVAKGRFFMVLECKLKVIYYVHFYVRMWVDGTEYFQYRITRITRELWRTKVKVIPSSGAIFRNRYYNSKFFLLLARCNKNRKKSCCCNCTV